MMNELFHTMLQPPIWPIAMIMVGLILGGFMTVAGDRLAQRAIAEDEGEEVPEGLGLWSPPSRCESCGRELKLIERLPVVGWLASGGKCRGCGWKVPVLLPLIELASGAAFGFVAWQFGSGMEGICALALTWWLLCLCLSDLRFFVLPDTLTLTLLWLGLIASAAGWRWVPIDHAVFGAALGYGLFWLVREGYALVRGRIGLGGGDLKLIAALGAWCGWAALPWLILGAASAGLVFFLVCKLFPKLYPEEHKPFGPFLAAAGWYLALFPPETLKFFMPS